MSERQETNKNAMEDKFQLQSRANERFHGQIVEEIKEIEQNNTEETLRMVQKKHDFLRIWKLEKSEEGSGLAASYLLGIVQILDG